MNVMRSSRLFRVSLFLENGSILMIWGCFSIVSNVIRSNYCCRRHTPCMETWCFLGILFSLPHNKADVYLRTASRYFMKINDCTLITAFKSNMFVSEYTHYAVGWMSPLHTSPTSTLLTTFPIIDQCSFPPVSSFSQTCLCLLHAIICDLTISH